MSEIDLDRLGDLWRQRPDPAEMETLRRSAAAVSRRARWGRFVDIVAAIAVSGVVIYFALSRPGATTVTLSAALILILLWSQRRQHRLRAIEIASLTGTAEEMLDQSISRTVATIKRTRLQSWLAPLTFVIAAPFFALGARESVDRLVERLLLGAQQADPLVLIGLAGMPVWAIYSVLTIRSERRQLARLAALRESYREEDAASEQDEV